MCSRSMRGQAVVMSGRPLPLQKGPCTVAGLRVLDEVPTRSVLAQRVTRTDGEVTWRQPLHRIVVPPRLTKPHPIVFQVEGGPTRQALWNDNLGFVPANVELRSVSAGATAVHLLWRPDPETAGRLEPMLPFHDSFISVNARAIASELEGEAPDPLFVESLGHTIIVRYMRQFSTRGLAAPRSSGLSRQRLRRVVDYIESHLGDALTLDVIAEIACLSPYHLSRSFRRAMGIGLHRYVVQRRIDRARQLVLSTDLAVSQIAVAVGFESPAAFATRFRQYTGQSPSSLRRN